MFRLVEMDCSVPIAKNVQFWVITYLTNPVLECSLPADVAYAVRENSLGRIDRAGAMLATGAGTIPRAEALDIVNNWRSCHSYALQAVRGVLGSRAERVSHKPLIAQRIKRLPSIIRKLKEETSMRLSQMQDIGGCRAVLNKVEEVEQLVALYEEDGKRIRKYDYIANPKPDGYRSVHLRVEYEGGEESKHNGRIIEIQIRTKLQHAWATALETCQTFTKQALRMKSQKAEQYWLRFFTLTSSAIAAIEFKPIVAGTPSATEERRRAIRGIIEQHKIWEQFHAWSATLNTANHDAAAYLLELNLHTLELSIKGFEKAGRAAERAYLEREKETDSDPNYQIVLVSAGSLKNLKQAYPNYYLDTSNFKRVIDRITNEPI